MCKNIFSPRQFFLNSKQKKILTSLLKSKSFFTIFTIIPLSDIIYSIHLRDVFPFVAWNLFGVLIWKEWLYENKRIISFYYYILTFIGTFVQIKRHLTKARWQLLQKVKHLAWIKCITNMITNLSYIYYII